MLIINFKRYLDLAAAVQMCKVCKWIGEETRVSVVACVEAEHLPACLAVGVECWTQRFETGARGYAGSLLNHSDYRLSWSQIQHQFLELMTHGKKVCICAATVQEAVEVSSFRSDFVAFEPPSLIGSREKSVASERPEEIAEVVNKLAPQQVFIGAGVHNGEDIEVGIKLGAKGFLIATDVVKAIDPAKELRELATVMKAATLPQEAGGVAEERDNVQ